MEIIKIYQGNVVSARELHQFLEVKTVFADWIKRMINYGFEEGSDYSTILKKENRQTLKEYYLTIGAAKEIAMLQRSVKGKQARKYFLECEQALLEIRENKRLAAFFKLEDTKSKFQSMLLDKGLEEQDYIEIDTAGKRVLMNGKVVEDGILQTVLLTARDLATQMTHHHTLQDELNQKDEIKNVNEENHIEVRKALLNKNIIPESLPQQEDIKKLQNGGEEGEQET